MISINKLINKIKIKCLGFIKVIPFVISIVIQTSRLTKMIEQHVPVMTVHFNEARRHINCDCGIQNVTNGT